MTPNSVMKFYVLMIVNACQIHALMKPVVHVIIMKQAFTVTTSHVVKIVSVCQRHV